MLLAHQRAEVSTLAIVSEYLLAHVLIHAFVSNLGKLRLQLYSRDVSVHIFIPHNLHKQSLHNMPKGKDSKIRRSRNGCNECRRLHRRCGEEKPSCQTCETDGKECSYERPLEWIKGSSKKATARARSAHSDSELILRTEGQHLSIQGLPESLEWLPWLSTRHRSLIAHFANITCSISFLDIKSHHDLCSAIVPLAVDNNWTFQLVAAMLSVSLQHQKSLGMNVSAKEVDYWESMAVGHMRRQVVGSDETSQNVFAATALLLCMREIFAGGEHPGSWRTHLHGAMAILDKPTTLNTLERPHLRKLGKAMHRLLLIFALPTHAKDTNLCTSAAHFASCDYFDEELGFSTAILHTLLDIEQVASDMTALLHLEHTSAEAGQEMAPLWASLMQRMNQIIEQSDTIVEDLAALKAEEEDSPTELTEDEEFALLNQAYYHITMSQVQLRLMGHDMESDAVQKALEAAMRCLMRIQFRDHSSPGMALLQPAFVIGSFAESKPLRQQALNILDCLKKKQGRENAERAKELLVELWQRRDSDTNVARDELLSWRQSLRVPHRSKVYEWSDLMAEKGWDLCLW